MVAAKDIAKTPDDPSRAASGQDWHDLGRGSRGLIEHKMRLNG